MARVDLAFGSGAACQVVISDSCRRAVGEERATALAALDNVDRLQPPAAMAALHARLRSALARMRDSAEAQLGAIDGHDGAAFLAAGSGYANAHTDLKQVEFEVNATARLGT